MKGTLCSLLLGTAMTASLLAVTAPAGAVIRINDGDSCPGVIAPVAYLYTAFFLREPDPQGLDYWVQFVSSDDGSLSAAAVAFAASPEFGDRYGEMTTEEFVSQLYPNVFGRAPDPAGLAFWVNDIDSERRTRSEVVLVWSLSEEFVGEDAEISPLIWDINRSETWCGEGARTVRLDRLPLDVGQQIGIRSTSEASLSIEITGRSENGTTVVSTGQLLEGEGWGPSLYLHPNLGQAVAYYEVRIAGSGAWVLVNEYQPPPWRTF